MPSELPSTSTRPNMRSNRPAVRDDVASRILELMRAGHLATGSRLPSERDLALQLGVSRPSVREAMRQLQAMGVIDIRHGSGAYVKEVTDEDLVQPLGLLIRGREHLLQDVLQTRRIIEPQLARMAADNATDADIRAMESLIQSQTAKLANGALAIEEDSAFHHLLARASGNRVMLLLVESCMDLLRESRTRNLQSPKRAQASADGHVRLLEAIKAHRPEEALSAMMDHLDGIEAAIQETQGMAVRVPRGLPR